MELANIKYDLKKAIILLVGFIVIVSFVLSLSGCIGNNAFKKIENTMSSAVKTIENVEKDSVSLDSAYAMGDAYSIIVSIKQVQGDINTSKAELTNTIQEVRVIISGLKDTKYEPKDADQEEFNKYISAVNKEMDNLKNTIGKVYKAMQGNLTNVEVLTSCKEEIVKRSDAIKNILNATNNIKDYLGNLSNE